MNDSVAGSYLMGYALHADRSHTDLGAIRAGEKATVRTTVRNIRSRPTTIIGVETSCGCANVNIDALPVELQPGEEHEFVLTIEASKSMSGKPQPITFRVFTDGGGPILTVRYTARVE